MRVGLGGWSGVKGGQLVRKWIILGVILVLLVGSLGGGGYVLTQTQAGADFRAKLKKKRDKPVVVRIGTVLRGDMTRKISAPGIVEPRKKVEISAQVSARVIALPLKEGDEVHKGDVVVRLDAQDLTARLEAAKARLRAQQARYKGSQADLAVALSDFGRKKELFESGDIAKTVYEQAENRYNQATAAEAMARADVEIANAQIIEAERNLAYTTISSPIDGVLTVLNAEVGELVVVGTLNSPGSVILEIADLSDMLFKARIDESAVARVKAGQDAAVYINAYRKKPFLGRVERVGLERKRWEDGTHYYQAEIVLEDDPQRPLLSGLSATADITVEHLTNVRIAPSQAVLDRRIDELPLRVLDNAGALIDRKKTFASVVYTIKDGKAVAVPVQTGPSDLTDTIILAGLNQGDQVITGPFKALSGLKDGTAVRDEKEVEAEKAAKKHQSEQPEAGDEGGPADAGAAGAEDESAKTKDPSETPAGTNATDDTSANPASADGTP